MARKPYRVEVTYPQGRSPQFYLAKDITVNDRKSKVRRYLRSGPVAPSGEELEKYRQEYAFDLEMKAAKKKAKMSSALYRSEYLTGDRITELEELRFIYRAFTELLTVNEAEVYEKNFEVHYIQGTTSIEGNTLTLKEAHDLLEYGTVPRSRPLREINEVQNFKNVIQYRNKYKGKVTLDLIRTLHSLIMNNIDAESAGTFRRIDDIGIAGCDLRLAPSELITEELQTAINEYYDRLGSGVHPFEAAVLFHYQFEIVHPFTDGNGRVGREVFNYLLMRERFPRLLFLGKDRGEYLAALKSGNNDDHADMVSTFSDLIMGQRMRVLIDNLQKVAVPLETTRRAKGGQKLIEDFLQIV